MLSLDELIDKWDYNPKRRTENKAGNKSISSAQLRYVKSLWANHPKEGEELIRIITETWNIEDMNDWKSADAMFFINKLSRI